MNFEISDDQQMMRETFARSLDNLSSPSKVKAAEKTGFDPELWNGLAEIGAFAIRVPADKGGLDLGTFDAVLLMEEVGRTLAVGPIAETLMAARVIALLGSDALDDVLAGNKIMSLAHHDIATNPVQWLAGGAHADLVVARRGGDVVLVSLSAEDRTLEPTIASDGIAEIDLGNAPSSVLGSGQVAIDIFTAAQEEWKLLMAAALTGLSQQAMRLASSYANERKAFGVLIGTFQGLSHPLADLFADSESGKYLVWRVIHDIAAGVADVAAHISLVFWWTATTAAKAAIQSTHTLGGYGLSTEYDLYLYNVRAKAWPAVRGDPQAMLEEAGRRLYAGETTVLPDVGDVPIDFDLGEDARALATETDEFFQRVLTPELKAHAHHSWEGHHPDVQQELAKADLLFPAWPKAKGGRGATPYARYLAAEAWAKHGWSSHATSTALMITALMDHFGGEKVRKEILEPVLRGEMLCSIGFSEPGSGSDVFAAQTKATRDGDGWRINGTKMFTSGANIADYALMLCRTDPDLPKHRGLTMFMVPLKDPGVTVQPVYTFQDERTNITFYDNVYIPDDYRLGEVNGGSKTMSVSLEMEHGGNGFSRQTMELAKAAETICRNKVTNGRPMIEQTPVQMRLAKAVCLSLLGNMLTLRSLYSAELKLDLPAAGSMSKMFTSEYFLKTGSDLMDLTAPVSLSMRAGGPALINLYYRFAHGSTTWAGTSEVHRSMVAERALGLPRSRN